jgi:GT2 family glycosyltransferase
MISVVIPTYKNKVQFLKNLKHNLKYLKDCEIIVVNDNPEQSLITELKKYKNVILIENDENLGFGLAVNIGVQKANNNLVMLLNNDVILNDESYRKAITQMNNNPKLFAISFAQIEKDGSIVGKNIVFWKQGLFLHQKAENLKAGENGWAEGGSCMINRKIFLDLSGFDPIYKPFYWEDIDLSYRAKKAGYSVLFDPNILVEHHHESTIGKYYSKEYIKTISFRNQFLFIWKNIRNFSQLISHFLLLPYNIIYYTVKGEFAFVKGFFQAIVVSLRETQ